jgi:cytochrome P450
MTEQRGWLGSRPTGPPFGQNPYPYYARLRRDSPVFRTPGTAAVYLVSRYAGVSAVLSDPETFSSADSSLTDALIGMDAGAHSRMRRSVQRSFTLARVRELADRVQEIVRDAMQGFATGAPFDVMGALAEPMPLLVIADVLGIDRARLADLRRWSVAIATHDERESAACRAFLEQHFAARSMHDDLASAEQAAIGMLLIVAGSETTMNLVGNAALIVARNAALQAWLREEPDRMERFLHEALRYESPVQALLRVTTRDTELGGAPVPSGARVAILLASANRDAEAFANAEAFQPDRHPNKHFAFGFGGHYCLGAQLALMEATAALRGLVGTGEFRLAQPSQPVQYRDSRWARGPARLEIQLSR